MLKEQAGNPTYFILYVCLCGKFSKLPEEVLVALPAEFSGGFFSLRIVQLS